MGIAPSSCAWKSLDYYCFFIFCFASHYAPKFHLAVSDPPYFKNSAYNLVCLCIKWLWIVIFNSQSAII